MLYFKSVAFCAVNLSFYIGQESETKDGNKRLGRLDPGHVVTAVMILVVFGDGAQCSFGTKNQ